jgi:hypothetical protein
MDMNAKPSKADHRKLVTDERRLLEEAINALSLRERTARGIIEAGWSIKDIMAHLAEWEQMFLGWYRAGLRGEMPETPAPGYTFGAKSLSLLNDSIYRKYRRRSLTDVQSCFDQSYREVLQALDGMTEDELNTPARYAWIGKHTVGDSLAANTWKHYRWAHVLIAKWSKRKKL